MGLKRILAFDCFTVIYVMFFTLNGSTRQFIPLNKTGSYLLMCAHGEYLCLGQKLDACELCKFDRIFL